MAISTYKIFLMQKKEAAWEKLIDIKEFPDLGGTPEMFADAAAAVAYVEEHGRPGGFDPDIIVVYEQGEHTVTITLKSLYTYVDIQ